MVSFYYFTTLLEGKTAGEACSEVANKFWPTAAMAVRVWPAVAIVNFTVVPERHRVPFISVCSLFWTCYLAYMKEQQPLAVAARQHTR